MNRLLLLGLAGLALSAWPGSTQGYDTYGYRWRDATGHMLLSDVSFHVGSAASADVEAALQAWNDVSRSKFLFTYARSNRGSTAFNHSDGVSGIAFAQRLGSGVLGVTYAEDWGRRRHAADVLFPTTVRWAYQRRPRRGEYHFFSIALHEFGHAVGLDHEDRWQAVMNSSASPGSVDPFTEDDKNGARHLYPGTSRGGGGPGAVPIAGQPDWRVTRLTVTPRSVRPGDTVTVEYTVENAGNGTAPRAPVRHYLLSTNQGITPQDQLLLEAPERNQPYSTGDTLKGGPWQITIPATVSPGNYWLGIFVDPKGQDAESNESNNASSVQLTVQGLGGTGGAQVDWTVDPLTVSPTRVVAGRSVTVQYRVRNAGAATASAVPDLKLYLSNNATISAQDTLVAGELGRGGSYPPGGGYSGTQSVGIVFLSPGTYYLGASIDPNNTVAEAREDNNVSVRQFVVVAAGPTPPPPPGPPPRPGPPPPSPPPANPPGTNVSFFSWPVQHQRSGNGWSAALRDVDRHLPRSYGTTYQDSDKITHAHETTHGINSHLRNHHNTTGRKANALYVMNDKAVLIVEPRLRKRQVAPYVPQSLRGSRYGTYVTGSASWDDTPTYLLDEWVAYTNGGVVGVELVKQGLWRGGWRDGVAGQLEFTIYAIALAMAVEVHDPSYFRQYTQFKEFIAWNARRAMTTYREGAQLQQFRWNRQDAYYRSIASSADAATLRAFVKRVYGARWAREVLGIN